MKYCTNKSLIAIIAMLCLVGAHAPEGLADTLPDAAAESHQAIVSVSILSGPVCDIDISGMTVEEITAAIQAKLGDIGRFNPITQILKLLDGTENITESSTESAEQYAGKNLTAIVQEWDMELGQLINKDGRVLAYKGEDYRLFVVASPDEMYNISCTPTVRELVRWISDKGPFRAFVLKTGLYSIDIRCLNDNSGRNIAIHYENDSPLVSRFESVFPYRILKTYENFRDLRIANPNWFVHGSSALPMLRFLLDPSCPAAPAFAVLSEQDYAAYPQIFGDFCIIHSLGKEDIARAQNAKDTRPGLCMLHEKKDVSETYSYAV